MLESTFTSTGAKFFAHEQAMANLRNGRGQPVTTHVMLTDRCNHTCAFCSVQARAGDSLEFGVVQEYLTTLQGYGLKSVILSGGGNPILYKKGGADFNDVVAWIHSRGLEIGLITNGMLLTNYELDEVDAGGYPLVRRSWRTVKPSTLDKLTWVRISMSGLDHDEREVYVPDIDPSKTTLGFSYVAHDVYYTPEEPHHGKVSTETDLLKLGLGKFDRVRWNFETRIPELVQEIGRCVAQYNPRYVRLLPNCLEPELIPKRVEQLEWMARRIDPEIVFVQNKPPKAPNVCLLGVVHPVLNTDGFCYPCDSCVLNEAAGHKFDNPWRMCHWSDIGKLYENKLPNSLIEDPSKLCPGCVFSRSNALLEGIRDGKIPLTTVGVPSEHVNFV